MRKINKICTSKASIAPSFGFVSVLVKLWAKHSVVQKPSLAPHFQSWIQWCAEKGKGRLLVLFVVSSARICQGFRVECMEGFPPDLKPVTRAGPSQDAERIPCTSGAGQSSSGIGYPGRRRLPAWKSRPRNHEAAGHCPLCPSRGRGSCAGDAWSGCAPTCAGAAGADAGRRWRRYCPRKSSGSCLPRSNTFPRWRHCWAGAGARSRCAYTEHTCRRGVGQPGPARSASACPPPSVRPAAASAAPLALSSETNQHNDLKCLCTITFHYSVAFKCVFAQHQVTKATKYEVCHQETRHFKNSPEENLSTRQAAY